MKGALRIGVWADIPVYVHWTFGFMLPLVVFMGRSNGFSWEATAWLGLLFLVLFVCVVGHEYGHALMARRYGVSTRDIILSPIGGIARLERLPARAIHEFYIAIAGPLVNVLIALLLSPYFLFFSPYEAAGPVISGAIFVPMLIAINVSLALFNLLPAFPMDGGRVLRALLSMRLGRVKATRVAAYVGQALAIALVGFGLWNLHFVMVFIGAFVFFMAGYEYKSVKAEAFLASYQIRDVCRPNFTRLLATEHMEAAAKRLMHSLEKSFLVLNEERQVIGVLHEADILQADKEGNLALYVKAYISTDFEEVGLEDSVKEVFYKMQQSQYTILPVMDEGQLVGVVDIYLLNSLLKLPPNWLQKN